MRGEHYLENSLKKPEMVIKELEELATKPAENVRELEKRMVEVYYEYDIHRYEHYVVECIEALRFQRWQLLTKSFEWTDENITRLEAMNEQLKTALLDMRRKTIEVYETLNHWRTPDKVLGVDGRLFVKDMVLEGWEYDEFMQGTLSELMLLQHIIYAVHNLYEHCHWSLQDLLGIRSYGIGIEIEQVDC